MNIDLHTDDLSPGGSHLRVAGEIDLATAPQLAVALDAALTSNGQVVVLDLSDVEFIDTSGVRALLDGRRLATERGKELTVIAPPGSAARRLLELTELIEALGVVESRDGTRADGV
jgi:anti-sigma B factor antagonist